MPTQKHPDVITAIEVGMVGLWGEMHTSQMANTFESEPAWWFGERVIVVDLFQGTLKLNLYNPQK